MVLGGQKRRRPEYPHPGVSRSGFASAS